MILLSFLVLTLFFDESGSPRGAEAHTKLLRVRAAPTHKVITRARCALHNRQSMDPLTLHGPRGPLLNTQTEEQAQFTPPTATWRDHASHVEEVCLRQVGGGLRRCLFGLSEGSGGRRPSCRCCRCCRSRRRRCDRCQLPKKRGWQEGSGAAQIEGGGVGGSGTASDAIADRQRCTRARARAGTRARARARSGASSRSCSRSRSRSRCRSRRGTRVGGTWQGRQ